MSILRLPLTAALLVLPACAAGVGPGAAEPASLTLAPELPSAPPPIEPTSLVPEGSRTVVLVRADLLRDAPVAPVLREWLRSDRSLSTLAGPDLDGLRDLDRLVVATGHENDEPEVVVVEHHVSEAQVVGAFARLVATDATASPPAPRIKTVEGRRVALVGEDPVRLLLASPTVAVLTTAARLSALIARLDAGAPGTPEIVARLNALDGAVPDLAPRAAVRVSSVALDDWQSGPGQLGLPRPMSVVALATFEAGADLFGEAHYASDSEAETFERNWRTVVSRGFNPVTIFLRLMGLARALESTQVVRNGSTVTVRAHLEPQELEILVQRLRSME